MSLPAVESADHIYVDKVDKEMESQELILTSNPSRFVMYPIRWFEVWELYKLQVASFWTIDEVDLRADPADWLALENDEKTFMKEVLAFFAASDGTVMENLLPSIFQTKCKSLKYVQFMDFSK